MVINLTQHNQRSAVVDRFRWFTLFVWLHACCMQQQMAACNNKTHQHTNMPITYRLLRVTTFITIWVTLLDTIRVILHAMATPITAHQISCCAFAIQLNSDCWTANLWLLNSHVLTCINNRTEHSPRYMGRSKFVGQVVPFRSTMSDHCPSMGSATSRVQYNNVQHVMLSSCVECSRCSVEHSLCVVMWKMRDRGRSIEQHASGLRLMIMIV